MTPASIRRMQRRHKRLKGTAGISLTSLMDIFTILVFFLLVNSQNSNKLPDTKSLVLPQSTSEKAPKENLIVMVTPSAILVQDQLVARVDDVRASTADIIPSLAQELKLRAAAMPTKLNEQGVPERDITIMGDKNIPYTVLRKIMTTCAVVDYSKIHFAVVRGGKS